MINTNLQARAPNNGMKWPQRVVCSIGLMLVAQLLATGLRLDSPPGKPQLDHSGWQKVGAALLASDHPREPFKSSGEPIVELASAGNSSTKFKKLVEWDDDELNDLQNQFDFAPEDRKQKNTNKSSSKSFPTNRKMSRKSNNRLVYHGKIKQNNSMTIIDGLKLYINTHKPVQISRRWSDQSWSNDLKYVAAAETRTSVVHNDRADSDWKPILMASRLRRTSKASPPSPKLKTRSERYLDESRDKTNIELVTKWKPISKKRSEVELETMAPPATTTPAPKTASVIYGRAKSNNIEDPFDDEDGVIVSRKLQMTDDDSNRKDRAKPKSVSDSIVKIQDNKWLPIDTTTPSSGHLSSTESQQASSAIPVVMSAASLGQQQHSLTNGTHPESAQKSASDLSYIYSQSQPDWLTTGRQSSNAYYSNYVIQPTSQQGNEPQIFQPPAGSIIDTTSGQTPEMIVERATESPSIEFSLPERGTSFQPALTPSRPVSYDPATSYYAQAQRVATGLQTIRQTVPPTSQIVRQEHHHHYYNQQQQQSERQSVTQPTVQPATSIIRELQPLLISQPLFQQPSTSTTTAPPSAPQIIREIIKEVQVPQVQPLQVTRMVLPPTIPISMSQPVARELDGSSYAAEAPAQRIIRQISNSIPTVTVRMPQIRLPLQLPIRLSNQVPVTRQTGSFVIPPMPKKTTTYLTETQAMPTHTTIMHTTQFTPATRTTVYTTDHQPERQTLSTTGSQGAYRR